jgi:SAM-dependent methyltransferase
MFLGMLAAQELLTVYLGVRLGLYAQLAQHGPATPVLLAERAGVAPRYAREWLEQQAVAGLLEVAEDAPAGGERVFRLPPGHAEVLLESDSPRSMVALTTLPIGGIARALPALLAAYRSGEGVPDAAFGEDWRDGHSGANRALFAHMLPTWVRTALPRAHAALAAGGRAVDVACGAGHAAVALARAYPVARVHALDVDAATVVLARRNAAEAAVADRVSFEVRDAADPALEGDYDLVCLFDALHELGRPVPVLRACRRLRRAGGDALVMDAKVAPAFVAPGDEVERFQYATSVLHCLPACLASQPSAGTGTVMRVERVRAYAREAGFGDARVLPIADRFHRFYQLVG